MRVPIVIFAQVPPPEHGQSRMVQRTLDALRADGEHFEVHHVNARFSETLEDVGESSLGKLALSLKFLCEALRLRPRLHAPILLYVPGPANLSPVLRDWILLCVLRLFYRRVVFHWHAIGHGEWAHGSKRLALDSPKWVDRLARAVSRRVLEKPYASISVSESSRKDAAAVASLREVIVPNGIEDPCPDYETSVEPVRLARLDALKTAGNPCFRILFLSHGTIEKGVLDAVFALRQLVDSCDPGWRFEVTFAGGLSENVVIRFEKEIDELELAGAGRLKVRQLGYVSGDEKRRCFVENDIFLSPSRWESFGLTVLEAMAFGMQIVAAASDGVQGVLPPGHPWLAPVASPGDLASMLRECCDDVLRDDNCRMARALRLRFLERFQLKGFSSNLRKAFHELGCLTSGYDISHNPQPIPSEVLGGSTAGPCENDSRGPGPVPPIPVTVYLADQNPGHDRSFGISRMSQTILAELQKSGKIKLHAIVSKTSQQAPSGMTERKVLPWGTRGKLVRLLTDHFHPLFHNGGRAPDVYYFPKGYLPLLHRLCQPSVVTIHDTIIQYDEDHYPHWRRSWEYAYWSWLLRHTLRNANRILTVSESSKRQIERFMHRHRIPPKEISVTYEPCQYECVPQVANNGKENYVIHLASREPHKRTAHLIRWWSQAEKEHRRLPTLHLIGTVPPEVEPLLASSRSLVKRPFLDDDALQAAYRGARALILPSEIEGFGLPALEAYYLGTPVCYVKDTSVEEILSPATTKGGFVLDDAESLFLALDEVLAMEADAVRLCGLRLRETYAAAKVADRMIAVFREVADGK